MTKEGELSDSDEEHGRGPRNNLSKAVGARFSNLKPNYMREEERNQRPGSNLSRKSATRYSEDPDEILFYFDLTLPDRRVKQIAVRRRDTARALIREHCKGEKGLTESSLRKLEKFLQAKI